jgi:hypothetical protein
VLQIVAKVLTHRCVAEQAAEAQLPVFACFVLGREADVLLVCCVLVFCVLVCCVLCAVVPCAVCWCAVCYGSGTSVLACFLSL